MSNFLITQSLLSQLATTGHFDVYRNLNSTNPDSDDYYGVPFRGKMRAVSASFLNAIRDQAKQEWPEFGWTHQQYGVVDTRTHDVLWVPRPGEDNVTVTLGPTHAIRLLKLKGRVDAFPQKISLGNPFANWKGFFSRLLGNAYGSH